MVCPCGSDDDGQSLQTPGSPMKSRVQSSALSVAVLSKIRFWILVAGVFALLGAGSASVFAQSANTYYKQGQAAEARDDFDAAYQNFQKAFSMAPKNEAYRTAYYRVRFTDASMHVTKGRNLLAAGDEQGALVELLRANEIDPSSEAAQQEIAKIRARHGQEPAVESSAPMSTQTRGDVEAISAPAQLKPMSNEPLSAYVRRFEARVSGHRQGRRHQRSV